MPSDQVRFIHASDFQLERPLRGLPQVPDELRDRLVDAPRLAAQRVFEAALLEEVDFVVLAGNIIDPRTADPRGMAFLLEQFELLREQKIAVYWAGGELDRPERWPEAVGLPDNVHVFAADRVEEVSHSRDDRPLATLMGTSLRQFRSTDFRCEQPAAWTMAVACGPLEAAAIEHSRIDYWALGGRRERQVVGTSPSGAQYCGSPQGGHPGELGPHGCLLVRGGDGGRPHVQFVATDAVRWHSVRLSVGDLASRDDLQSLLVERIRGLASDSADQPLLVCCEVEATGRLGARLRQEGLADEILTWLRKTLLKSSPPIWTVSLQAPFTAEIPADWKEEDTILGDYLRAVDGHRQDRRQALDVRMFLSPAATGTPLETMLLLPDGESREHVLQRAAELGADLLRGDHV
ncbi:MAG: hypothetical protein J5I93_13750 [Pirellulaceae bacterium]|nr:hypothetical protein [Pirellulaceae bacterium]